MKRKQVHDIIFEGYDNLDEAYMLCFHVVMCTLTYATTLIDVHLRVGLFQP